MPKSYSNEDAVNIPGAVSENAETISVTPTSQPEVPPTTPLEPIAEVESTRAPEAEPELHEQFFKSEGEELPPPDVEPAPMDAPVEVPAADAAPADAPVPAAPAPIADIPTAAPIGTPSVATDGGLPQPEAEVAPVTAPEAAIPPVAPIAPEVAAPADGSGVEPVTAAPVEAPVDDSPVQCTGGGNGKGRGWKNEGETISVVDTPPPTEPKGSETEECPVTGEPVVTKDITEPINPVLKAEGEADAANIEDGSAGGTVPVKVDTVNDRSMVEPEVTETQGEAASEISNITNSMRMEGEEEMIPEAETSTAGDQEVKVAVHVEGPDADSHEVEDGGEGSTAPEVTQRMKQEDVSIPVEVETVADTAAPAAIPADIPEESAEAIVPTPEMIFNQEGFI